MKQKFYDRGGMTVREVEKKRQADVSVIQMSERAYLRLTCTRSNKARRQENRDTIARTKVAYKDSNILG